MPFLALLWGASGLTSIGKYLIIGVVGLGLAGWMISGITAPYKAQIATLKAEKSDLIEASIFKEKLAESDRKRAEDAEAAQVKSALELEGVLHEVNAKPASCKLSSDELDLLRKLGSGAAR